MLFSASGFFGTLLNIRTHTVLMYLMSFLFVSKKVAGGVKYEYLEAGICYAVALQLSYIYNKVRDAKEDAYNGETLSVNGFFSEKWNLIFLGTAVSVYLSFRQPVLIPVLIYAFAVIVPYEKYKGVFAMKSVSLTAGFFLMSVLSPCLIRDPQAYLYLDRIFLSSVSMLAMVFSITVTFDIRDAKGDAMAGLRTIPVVLGGGATILFITLLMAVSLYLDPIKETRTANLINCAVITALSAAGLKTGRKAFYDGIIFLQTAFLALLLWKA